MKKILIIVLVAIILIAIAVLNFTDEPAGDQETIKVGGIFALTGVGAAIGEEESKGARLAIDEINKKGGVLGMQLDFIIEDLSIDKLKDAGSVGQKLINVNDVVAIIGPQWDEPAIALLPLIEEFGVPTIGTDTTDSIEDENVGEHLFSTWYNNRVGIEELLRFTRDKGITDVAIFRMVDGGFWKFTADYLTEKASEFGINIVDDFDLGNPLSLDFRTSLTKVNTTNPQAIFAVVSDYNQCAFVSQAKDIGFEGIFLATESAGDSVALRNCPGDMESLYFSTPINESEEYDRFIQLFNDKYGRDPLYPSAVTAYDAVRVLADAIKRAGSADRESIQEALKITSGFPGASLPEITFNEKGFVITSDDTFQMRTVRNGEFVKPE